MIDAKSSVERDPTKWNNSEQEEQEEWKEWNELHRTYVLLCSERRKMTLTLRPVAITT